MGNGLHKGIETWFDNLPSSGESSYDAKFGVCSLLDEAERQGESRFMIELIRSREGIIRNWLVNKTGRTLDVCCGTGNQSVFLACLGNEVVGLDLSRQCLSIAKDKARKLNVRVDLICGNATHLPFPSNTFDTVTSFFALHFINPGYEQATAELVRVLKMDGTLMLEVYNAVTPFKVFDNTPRRILAAGKRGEDIAWEKSSNIRIHLFAPDELLEILQKQGISVHSVYGLWGVASLPSPRFHRNHKTFSNIWGRIGWRIDRFVGKYYPFNARMSLMLVIGQKR